MSKSHLTRVFTAAVGVPPGRYRTSVRIEAAMKLLLHREYSLDVVASLCGFSGANYLCRVFKKETGQTPAQWRGAPPRTAPADLTAGGKTPQQGQVFFTGKNGQPQKKNCDVQKTARGV